jgi:hypothetical protein
VCGLRRVRFRVCRRQSSGLRLSDMSAGRLLTARSPAPRDGAGLKLGLREVSADSHTRTRQHTGPPPVHHCVLDSAVPADELHMQRLPHCGVAVNTPLLLLLHLLVVQKVEQCVHCVAESLQPTRRVQRRPATKKTKSGKIILVMMLPCVAPRAENVQPRSATTPGEFSAVVVGTPSIYERRRGSGQGQGGAHQKTMMESTQRWSCRHCWCSRPPACAQRVAAAVAGSGITTTGGRWPCSAPLGCGHVRFRRYTDLPRPVLIQSNLVLNLIKL